MKGLLAFALTALAVGVVVTFGLPRATAYFPDEVNRNQWVRVAAVGAVVMGGLFLAAKVLKAAKLPIKMGHGG